MPNSVEIVRATKVKETIDTELKDGWIAFSYPGKFVGYGKGICGAAVAAYRRYEAAKKKFLENNVEGVWYTYAVNREAKIEKIHSTNGITTESVWDEHTLQQQKENVK